MTRVLFFPTVALSILAFVACGSDTGGEGGSGSGAGGSGAGQGYVKCGDLTCNPGQHCFNIICESGCQSNDNCAANQTCEDIDDFSHVGTCKNGSTPPTKDCDAFCAKAAACGQTITPAQCQQACAAFSAECVTCVNDSNCGVGCDAVCGL